MQRELSTEQQLAELGEAARRAGAIVTEHINSIVEGAERHAQKIIADAHHDAERTRRDALDSAQRLLEHLHALERPLGQLVMNLQAEVDRVAGELTTGGFVDARPAGIGAPGEPDSSHAVDVEAEDEDGEAEPHATRGEPAPAQATNQGSGAEEAVSEAQLGAEERAEEEAAAAAEAAEEESVVEEEPESPAAEEFAAEEPEPVPAEESAAEEPDPSADGEPSPVGAPEPAAAAAATLLHESPEPAAAAQAPEAAPRRGLLSRLRRSGSGVFISTEGHCAVCQRGFMAGSKENLRLSGWLVSGDVGLCPECQSEGWQLPEGARLPFRRGGS